MVGMYRSPSLHKGKGGGVPGGVPPGFEGAPQSPGGEGGGVRLSPDELLARELQQYLAAAVGVQEAVVLFAVAPVMGWNQWVKWVAPSSRAHCFMASAISLRRCERPGFFRR